MSCVFVGCPRIILHAQNSGLLHRLLSPAFSASVHRAFLKSLTSMLAAEEVRIVEVSNS